ncbi:MAG: ATP-binding protein [Chlamydiae bacterium]|nr:ATP-binding protein [Chlamydiota bacterium]MBI3276590.1 ATP-binding protein [Chlamydiota bacterium]
MIPRKASAILSQIIKNKETFNNVVLVEGARQVGKTTLVRETLKGLSIPFKEFNLEEKGTLCEKIDLCKDFDEFTQLVDFEMQFPRGQDIFLFIDEAQESRKLGGFIRFMKEKWENTQVILSGSSLSRIFRDETRYPVGRVTPLHLQPLSFEEFLIGQGQQKLVSQLQSIFPEKRAIAPSTHQLLLDNLQKYMEVGGLPEVVHLFSQGKNWHQKRLEILLGYYNDFKRIFGETFQPYLVAALKTTAYLLGSPFKNTHVSFLLEGGKNQEIIKALGQLENWKIIFRVDQRGSFPESHFHPKRYLFDIGIAKELRESVVPPIHLLKTLNEVDRTSLGGLIENMVVNALVSQTPKLCGWKKSSSGSEVDLVLKRNDDIIPIECKSSLTIKNSHLSGLRDFMSVFKVPKGFVVSLAPFEVRKLSAQQTLILLPLYLVESWQRFI